MESQDIPNNTEASEVFHMVPGSEIAEGPHVEISLLPNKAVVWQNVSVLQLLTSPMLKGR